MIKENVFILLHLTICIISFLLASLLFAGLFYIYLAEISAILMTGSLMFGTPAALIAFLMMMKKWDTVYKSSFKKRRELALGVSAFYGLITVVGWVVFVPVALITVYIHHCLLWVFQKPLEFLDIT